MEGRARVVWLGHASVLIELDGVRLLTDPLLGRRLGPLVRLYPPPSPEHMRDIDAVLISHLHADHADVGSLRRLGPGVPILAPAGAAAWLAGRGFERVRELTHDEEYDIGALSVRATHAEHEGRRHPFAPESDAQGYVVGGTRVVYFAGDTDIFEGMERLARGIDVALLPVGGWGPTLGPGHLDPARAAEALLLLRPAVAVPIHWGSLALPWRVRSARRTDVRGLEFAARAARVAPDVQVRVLRPNQELELATASAHGA